MWPIYSYGARYSSVTYVSYRTSFICFAANYFASVYVFWFRNCNMYKLKQIYTLSTLYSSSLIVWVLFRLVPTCSYGHQCWRPKRSHPRLAPAENYSSDLTVGIFERGPLCCGTQHRNETWSRWTSIKIWHYTSQTQLNISYCVECQINYYMFRPLLFN
jgi:hypothetical protein